MRKHPPSDPFNSTKRRPPYDPFAVSTDLPTVADSLDLGPGLFKWWAWLSTSGIVFELSRIYVALGAQVFSTRGLERCVDAIMITVILSLLIVLGYGGALFFFAVRNRVYRMGTRTPRPLFATANVWLGMLLASIMGWIGSLIVRT